MAELKFNYRRRLLIKIKHLALFHARQQIVGTLQEPIQEGLKLRLSRKKRRMSKLTFVWRRKS